MVYSNKQVFTTDIGLGCYYVTNVDNGSTIAVEHPSILTGVTSIAVDPSGNVIVAATGFNRHSSIHIFSKDHEYVKTLSNSGVELQVGF
jgi:hypothetical protein